MQAHARHWRERMQKAKAVWECARRLSRLPPSCKKQIACSQLLPILTYGPEAFPIHCKPAHLKWDRQAVKGLTYMVTDRGPHRWWQKTISRMEYDKCKCGIAQNAAQLMRYRWWEAARGGRKGKSGRTRIGTERWGGSFSGK